MIESIARYLELPIGVIWGIIALAALQLIVQIWALVDLSRRSRVLFDKKWVWALVIIFFGNSFIGPIIYLALGRNVPQEAEPALDPAMAAPATSERTQRAVDVLYDKDRTQ